MTEYRGYRLERFDGTQFGHKTGGGLRASLGIGTQRKVSFWEASGPDEHTFTADTLKDAKRRIDSYLD